MMTDQGFQRWNRTRQGGRIRFALVYGSVIFGVIFTLVVSAMLTVIVPVVISSDVKFTKIVLCVAPLAVIVGFVTGLWLWERIEYEYQDQKKRNETNA
jgi:ABC-type bacteriocin/lantibiotic exporter with double-glycine peptidase domain